MNKFLLWIIFAFLFNLNVYAQEITNTIFSENNEDTVILDVKTNNKSEILNKKSLPNSLSINSENTSENPKKNYSKYDPNSIYSKKNASYKKEKKIKNIDVGATYDASFTPENVSQTRKLYTKYNVNDNLSVGASYKNEASSPESNLIKGSVAVTPEYRINQHFAIQNSFSKNLNNHSSKEEITIELNPLKDKDRMYLDFGAGYVQYDNGSPSSSQLNFGTNFKF